MVTKQEAKDKLKVRLFPCVIAYVNPTCLIYSNSVLEWSVERIGKKYRWDNIRLHEIVGGIELNKREYPLIICRDGGIALPAVYGYDEHRIAREFNIILASFMLGGFYVRAVDIENIETGFKIDNKYIKADRYSNCYPNQFHRNIRFGNENDIDGAILNCSNIMYLSDLAMIYGVGSRIVESLDGISFDVLLRGVTKLEKREWLDSLSLLWIVIEQLVDQIWIREIVGESNVDSSRGRLSQLQDNRSWTMANKIEVFFHKKIVTMSTLEKLNISRKARNNLVHKGVYPARSDVKSAFDSIYDLIISLVPNFDCAIFKGGFDKIVGSSLVKGDGLVAATVDAEQPLLPGEEQIHELVEIAMRD